MLRNSLTFRLISLSVGWIALALITTGLMLTYFYRDHIEEHYDAHVFSHLKELVEASHIESDGSLVLDSYPTDPRFHEPLSGWYWEIRHNGRPVARSTSLGDETFDLTHDHGPDVMHVHELMGPNQQMLRVQVLEFAVPGSESPLTYLASAPIMTITSDVENYQGHVQMSLLVLGIGLMLAVVLQVRVALRPLNSIEEAIGEVRFGRSKKLPRSFPVDVQPLVDELNRLLAHNTFLLKRARNQLGDLAHSVKNPLTVIANEARQMPKEQRQLLTEQTRDISRSIEHHLSRARTYGQANVMGFRTAVRPVAEDLAFVMRRTYKQRELEIHLSGLDDCWFGGEAQDLEEMLGNLLDNACKWADHEVWLRGELSDDRMRLIVEDDGPGIPEPQYEKVVQRGFKIDEASSGHGLGLSIVQEIVNLYGGKLRLARSARGGLRAELDLGAVW